MNRCPELL